MNDQTIAVPLPLGAAARTLGAVLLDVARSSPYPLAHGVQGRYDRALEDFVDAADALGGGDVVERQPLDLASLADSDSAFVESVGLAVAAKLKPDLDAYLDSAKEAFEAKLNEMAGGAQASLDEKIAAAQAAAAAAVPAAVAKPKT